MMRTKLHLVVQIPGVCLTGYSSQSGNWFFILNPDLHYVVSCSVGHCQVRTVHVYSVCLGFICLTMHIYLVASVVCPTQIGCYIVEVQMNLSTRILVQ